MKKQSIYLLAFLCGSFIGLSQDQIFLNPNQSLLYTNPSFAGSNGSLRNQTLYTSLQPGSSSDDVTYYNGLDGYVKRLHGGIAISGMVNDLYHGMFRTSALNLIYAPIFACKESGLKIIPSIQIRAFQKQVDVERLTLGNSYILWNPNGSAPVSKKNNIDGSAALLVNYKNVFIGGTVYHINEPDQGVLGSEKLPRRYTFNVSYAIPLNQKTLIQFSGLASTQLGYNSLQLTANAVFLKHVTTGFGYAFDDAAFFNLGYRNNYFSVSAGYIIYYSKLAANPSNALQVALGLSLNRKQAGEVPVSFEKW
ncbi:hypothetical protein CNR22_09450 [Sphingobacteriaceae bacterium]|nr:hypothetical protein CNR22_09450 [Sphingobacteriaceae bacterium]